MSLLSSLWVTLNTHQVHSPVHGHLFSWNCRSQSKTYLVLLVYFIGNTMGASAKCELRTSSLSELTANSPAQLSYVNPQCGHCVTLRD